MGGARVAARPEISVGQLRTRSVRESCERVFVPARAATILHADLDAFYASVEQRDDPRLCRRPVIVGGGVVLAASYEAKRCGVRTAMGGRQARRLCPYAAVVPPRISAYVEASRAVFAVFERHAPVVEALSIDEAFLDVRGLEHINGTPLQIAERLRAGGARAGRAADHRRGRARRSSWPRWRAPPAKPDGLLRGAARRRARVPAPAAGGGACGGWGG